MSVWSIKYLLLHRDDLLSYHLLCREPLDSFWNLITRAKILRQSRRFVLQGCFGRLKSFFIFAGRVCENTNPDGKKKPLCFPSQATYPCNPFYKVIKILLKRWLGYLPFAGVDQPFIHAQFYFLLPLLPISLTIALPSECLPRWCVHSRVSLFGLFFLFLLVNLGFLFFPCEIFSPAFPVPWYWAQLRNAVHWALTWPRAVGSVFSCCYMIPRSLFLGRATLPAS